MFLALTGNCACAGICILAQPKHFAQRCSVAAACFCMLLRLYVVLCLCRYVPRQSTLRSCCCGMLLHTVAPICGAVLVLAFAQPKHFAQLLLRHASARDCTYRWCCACAGICPGKALCAAVAAACFCRRLHQRVVPCLCWHLPSQSTLRSRCCGML